jgi:hypothetical protein
MSSPEHAQFEQQAIAVVNAGGNEPGILGAGLGIELNNELIAAGEAAKQIIIPVGSKGELAVLKDEFKGTPGAENIVIDDRAGAILASARSTQGDFAEHINVLATEHDPMRQELNAHLGRAATAPFTGHNLQGEPVTIDPAKIIASIETGSRVATDHPLRVSVFPVQFSKLVQATRENPALGANYSQSQMMQVEQQAGKAEQGLAATYLPLVNTLSHQSLSLEPASMRDKFEELKTQPTRVNGKEITYTPPMKNMEPIKDFKGVDKPGLYTMESGTGRAASRINDAAVRATEQVGMEVYTVPWGENPEGTTKAPAAAFASPNVKGIIHRGGQGTSWRAANLALPDFVVAPEAGDDPEMELNHETMRRLGNGLIIKDPDTFTGQALQEQIAILKPRAEELRDLTAEHFETPDGGLKYMAKHLAGILRRSGQL